MIKYEVHYSKKFKKSLRKALKQGKDIDKLLYIVNLIASEETLPAKHKNHKLVNDKSYKNCCECHIEPDWLLIYEYINDKLILLLIDTGSHSELFLF